MRTERFVPVLAIALFTLACGEFTQPDSSLILTNAFSTVPTGFDQTSSSFEGTGSGLGGPFMPHDGRGSRGGGAGGLMGGGLGAGFLGGMGFGPGHRGGPGHGHGPFHPLGGASLTCTGVFAAATGRVTCEPVTDRGLTIARSIAYRNSAGIAQAAYDSATTNTVNIQTSVAGTVTRRDSTTATVNHTSDRTIGGLAPGSTQRTVDGASRGQEDISGEIHDTAFTAQRIVADTTRGLVIPLQDGRPTYPSAGTVIRVMQVTVTKTGGSPTTHSRREVITYDGSSSASVVITADGTTKQCTMPLPRGRPTCD